MKPTATLFLNVRYLMQVSENRPAVRSGRSMDDLPVLEDAWMAVSDGKVEAYGTMQELELSRFNAYEKKDVAGRSMIPLWVDSHTHLVFAAPREREFEDRIKGLTYQEIAARGGGILNSAAKLGSMSEDDLYEAALERLKSVIRMGTGAIEIKSGYGLNLEAELKMLRVAKRLGEAGLIPVKSSFLGAHAVPARLKGNKDAYVDEVVNEMIPAVAAEGLAEYVDAFCEEGYFDVADLHRILEAGVKHGMKPKTHVNQFSTLGGVAKSVEFGAVSVDHLEELAEADITALQGSDTLPVALPLCSLFLSIPYTPGRRLIDAGLPLVLATDFNPGSSPSGNMNLAVSLACIKMKLTPAEAINAATLNAAAALELQDELGSLTPGKRASFSITKRIPSVASLPYSFGELQLEEIWLDGAKFE
ncbi:MAG: imidazolonepropionase [Flavobacteriales bacterium]